MALSKQHQEMFGVKSRDKINRLECRECTGAANKEEIIIFCKVEYSKMQSVEIIRW